MRKSISVRFFARKDRATEEGLAPVFMRVGIGEKRINIITKINVKLSEWSVEHLKLKSSSDEARKINKLLKDSNSRLFIINAN